MGSACKIAIVSDIHYASAAEQARGDDYEYREITNPFLRTFVHGYRHYIWLRDPLRQNHRLDEFIADAGKPDHVVAHGDYSCDSAFVGVCDDAAFASARECLEKLRNAFGPNLHASMGDHELGKMSFIGGRGGMRTASWHRARQELGLEGLWRVAIGNYRLIGVASSLVALAAFEGDTLPEEREAWQALREEHLAGIRKMFGEIEPGQKVIFFCHDPTALPYLWHEPAVREKLPQIEQTIIGHLHTNLVFWKARLLAGMPVIRFMGYTAKRMTTALSEARHWRPFNVRLCPALAGTQLLKDGGYYRMELDPSAKTPAKFEFRKLPRRQS